MGKRSRVRGDGSDPVGSMPGNPVDAKMAKLEAATAKAERATQQLREVTSEAHHSIQASKDAGDRMVRAVVKEFERQGIGALVNCRIDAYLKARQDEIYAVYADALAAFKEREKATRQQTARASEAIEILEKWVARLFLLSSSTKFRAVAREVLGNEADDGDITDPFKAARDETHAFLDKGRSRSFDMEDPTTGCKVVLHLDPPKSNED